jgi:hypothetical protein
LDTTGSLPSPEKLAAWLENQPVDRELVIQEALNSREFLSRWSSFFDDMFHIRKVADKHHRYALRSMFRQFLKQNAGWDEIARALLTFAGPLSNGQTSYAAWHEANGVDNTLIQDIFDDRAGYFSAKLLGIETRCISCHDGVYHLEEVNVDLTARKRKEFWGLAAFFAGATVFCPDGGTCNLNVTFGEEDGPVFVDLDGAGPALGTGSFYDPLFIHEGEYLAESSGGEGMRPARNGGIVQPRYPFNGEVPQPGETRREALARIMTADRQFARNMVNRLWYHFMGSTFVWPLEKFDLARLNAEVAHRNDTTVQPSDPEFLEYLTDLFIEGDYRIKTFIAAICASQVYQLGYADLPAHDYGPYWGGALRVRRLEAESIANSITWAAGVRLGYVDHDGENLRYNPWDFLQDEPEVGYVTYVAPMFFSMGITTRIELINYQISMSEFLAGLGRGNRDQDTARKQVIDQESMLFMMNSIWLLNEVLDRSTVVDDLFTAWRNNGDSQAVVSEIYRRTLFRTPTAAELARDGTHLETLASRAAVADIMWRAFCSEDFLYR